MNKRRKEDPPSDTYSLANIIQILLRLRAFCSRQRLLIRMKLRVLYHGHCFDGVASAATFTRFYKEQINPEAEVHYTGLLHRPGNLFDEEMFDGDENAIVDFKYSPSEKLTWWFDHHESAFLTPEDEAHFRAHQSSQKFLDVNR